MTVVTAFKHESSFCQGSDRTERKHKTQEGRTSTQTAVSNPHLLPAILSVPCPLQGGVQLPPGPLQRLGQKKNWTPPFTRAPGGHCPGCLRLSSEATVCRVHPCLTGAAVSRESTHGAGTLFNKLPSGPQSLRAGSPEPPGRAACRFSAKETLLTYGQPRGARLPCLGSTSVLSQSRTHSPGHGAVSGAASRHGGIAFPGDRLLTAFALR